MLFNFPRCCSGYLELSKSTELLSMNKAHMERPKAETTLYPVCVLLTPEITEYVPSISCKIGFISRIIIMVLYSHGKLVLCQSHYYITVMLYICLLYWRVYHSMSYDSQHHSVLSVLPLTKHETCCCPFNVSYSTRCT